MRSVVSPQRAVVVVTKIKSEGDLGARLRFRFGADEGTVPVGQSLAIQLPERPRVRFDVARGVFSDNFVNLETMARAAAEAVLAAESARLRGENSAVVGIVLPMDGAGGDVLQLQVEMTEGDDFVTYIDRADPFVGARGAPAVVRRSIGRSPAWSR